MPTWRPEAVQCDVRRRGDSGDAVMARWLQSVRLQHLAASSAAGGVGTGGFCGGGLAYPPRREPHAQALRLRARAAQPSGRQHAGGLAHDGLLLYNWSGQATVKSDVHSFWVVLLQLISGRRPSTPASL
ncbi:hypothetical protein PVAP13_1KG378700 [Panicum virgatum]|uniref:Uncharacterized protein n=1 Tax=Panicum virgatum TaxID=38727 RepID=A0A8T0XE09_PANVG|nr:hypothetical protein PVAP13_1KG378700 [Panicum virgatum]